ncbi:MAG: threonine synthase [Proteobacteria bacterium]|nr:threonine synthase [Pseudomonadota bacterium]
MSFHLACVGCGTTYDGLKLRYRCDCGETLDVIHDLERLKGTLSTATFDARRISRDRLDKSGVWRFRELILDVAPEHVVTKPEGNTNLYDAPRVASWVGLDALALKHEGENPTGSFKDRGMTGGVTAAKRLGATRVACASTGNTSASMASYAAQAGMEALVFIPDGEIAYGKLSQALAYGARTAQISGDFDKAMELVQDLCNDEGIYLLNSVNPFRIEGQKAIGFEILQDLGWQVPDWIVLPGGNLGNNSALSKGMAELYALGLIDKLPRMAVVQAAGANPLYKAFAAETVELERVSAKTLATAIQIGNPVSWKKSIRGLLALDGVVTEVTDQEILDAKAQVDGQGIGAEPASCATVAGIKRLVAEGVIAPDAHVVGILTGNLLKDPDIVVGYHKSTLEGFTSTYANAPTRIGSTLADVKAWLEG